MWKSLAASAALAAVSGADTRDEIALTVYNSDFGLVREVREVDLGKGAVSLEFADVAETIQPETVLIRSLAGGDALRVLDQTYRYDLLSPTKLLEKYVGRAVTVYRWNDVAGREEATPAEVLAVNGGTILKIGEEITFNYPGRIGFPEIPEDLIASPTLEWNLESRRATQKLEVSYIARGMGWKADYVLRLGPDAERANLRGWVTLTNESGASYAGAKLKLVAGDVQRVRDERVFDRVRRMSTMAAESAFEEESFFEYHLYTLDRPADLPNRSQKQISLLAADGVRVNKKLVFRGQSRWFRGGFGDVPQSQKVGVFLEIENTKASGLGMPLPAGVLRVYQADASGASQFVGEDRIDHTPRDEKVSVQMGNAFDVVAERKKLSERVIGSCVRETAWSVEIRNHKDSAARVEILEPVDADWEILESNFTVKKVDAHHFRIDLDVPARGSRELRYSVRVRWC